MTSGGLANLFKQVKERLDPEVEKILTRLQVVSFVVMRLRQELMERTNGNGYFKMKMFVFISFVQVVVKRLLKK